MREWLHGPALILSSAILCAAGWACSKRSAGPSEAEKTAPTPSPAVAPGATGAGAPGGPVEVGEIRPPARDPVSPVSHPPIAPRGGAAAEAPRVFAAARLAPGQEPALLLPAPRSWRVVKPTGEPEAIVVEGGPLAAVAVRLELDASTLPPALASLRGARVEFMSRRGTRVCTATIVEFYRAETYAGERIAYVSASSRDTWNRLARAGQLTELGAAMWRQAKNTASFLATVAIDGGGCEDALWARLPVESRPRLGVEMQDEKLAKRVADTVWKHAMYDEYTARYELEEPPHTRAEWDEMLADSIEVTLYGFAGDRPSLALLRTDLGDLTYSIAEDGSLGEESPAAICAQLIGALDVDVDGALDILSATDFGAGCVEASAASRVRF